MSWPAAASTPRERRRETIAVEAGRRHLAQRGGDRAKSAQAVGAVLECLDRGCDPTGVGGLDAQHLEPSVAPAALGQGGVEPLAVQPGAFASPRPPLLARPEVVHEPEGHVGHRLAVGHGDRQGVAGDAALGVQRPVDRVDDHPHLVIAVAITPRSSDTAQNR